MTSSVMPSRRYSSSLAPLRWPLIEKRDFAGNYPSRDNRTISPYVRTTCKHFKCNSLCYFLTHDMTACGDRRGPVIQILMIINKLLGCRYRLSAPAAQESPTPGRLLLPGPCRGSAFQWPCVRGRRCSVTPREKGGYSSHFRRGPENGLVPVYVYRHSRTDGAQCS